MASDPGDFYETPKMPLRMDSDYAIELANVDPSSQFDSLWYDVHAPTNESQTEDFEYAEAETLAVSLTAEDLGLTQPSRIQGSCPANKDWSGDHNFRISFEKERKLTNGADWTFSSQMDKLYVNMDVSCTINFHTDTIPPEGIIIRALPVFVKPKHSSEAVLRCMMHSNVMDPTNVTSPGIACHLIRCEAMHATYHTEQVTNRMSVTVPYHRPEEGMEHICYVYKFMCFCSCAGGGIGKRPIQIIFTLENEGEVIGRKALNIRICASPGRDRRAEEEKEAAGRKIPCPKRETVTAERGHCSKSEHGKRLKASKDDVHVLYVKGKKNYKTLKYLNDLMQFKDSTLNAKDDDSN